MTEYVYDRFEFGKNWERFLQQVDDERVATAEESLLEMLERRDLQGLTFLDVGSGSGLFSLAARRLGATVTSIDNDEYSVKCTNELKRRHNSEDAAWRISQASVLDRTYMDAVDEHDIVYSWGVLHHTGDMWRALDNVIRAVRRDGYLYIAIYNDQGRKSRTWLKIKRFYNRCPRTARTLIECLAFGRLWGPTILRDAMMGRPFHSFRNYSSFRGMSPWCDVIDWVGGYPFEVATPERIHEFCLVKGLRRARLRSVGGGHGCNEYVYRRIEKPG